MSKQAFNDEIKNLVETGKLDNVAVVSIKNGKSTMLKRQRWTDREVVERIIEGAKNHWYHICKELEHEDGWKGTWADFGLKWKNWDDRIHEYYYHIEQTQQALDITNEEMEALLKEEQEWMK